MIHTVIKFIESNQLLNKSDHIIVGLSGGADSVVLLDVLCRLGYSCIAAHCNFHLRGEESDRDESFARNFAATLNVEFVKIDFDTVSYANKHKVSIEMAARSLRYDWFEEIRKLYNAQAIAVAHHQDDSVETLLLNLIRGTGVRGMTGIKPHNGYIVRPFLSISRNDIIVYAQKYGLDYITDSTNQSDVYTRNFIRLNVLPLLEQINPSVRQSISRTAEHLSDVEKIYLDVIEDARENILFDNKLSIQKLKTYPSPKTILYELLKDYGFTRAVVSEIYRSLDGLSGKKFYSKDFFLIKDRDFLLLFLNNIVALDVNYNVNMICDKVELPLPLIFERKTNFIISQIEKSLSVATFDFDKLSFPLVIRKWRKGDWFIPFGMKGKKKVSDFFTDNKFSLADKDATWLLCSGDNIIWIIGKRADNRFKVDEKTKNIYIVRLLADFL